MTRLVVSTYMRQLRDVVAVDGRQLVKQGNGCFGLVVASKTYH